MYSEQKDEYIRAKYVEKAFLSKDVISRSPPPDLRLHVLFYPRTPLSYHHIITRI
jgi:hypothetical protein